MTTEYYSDCPICSKNNTPSRQEDYGAWRRIDCDICRPFLIFDDLIKNRDFSELQKIAIFSENHRKVGKTQNGLLLKLNQSEIKTICDNFSNYTPVELLDNFLIFVCQRYEPGHEITLNTLEVAMMAGARSFASCYWILSQCNNLGWFDHYDEFMGGGRAYSANCSFTVSYDGWVRYYELNHLEKSSKQAFMAMSFGNDDLREKILPSIKSACSKAGFELLAVNEKRQAGLIDDKIRVDIRNSRFLVVDLSDQNQGAYFEAGFAEGLGKPVFYICDEEVFNLHHNRENGEKTVHFDVEHHDIIQWNKSVPEIAAEELLASIRNTLPDDSNMLD